VTSGYGTSCALLTSGHVDCWGWGHSGTLGNGKFYEASPYGSALPVAVKGVGGTGTLSGVASIASLDYYSSFCALLVSGEVDCWGWGADGELGNGTFYAGIHEGSAFPVAVKGVGGSGVLTGVAGLTGSDEVFCARLTSGKVDCWGGGGEGELGNGTIGMSAVPVAVRGVGGPRTLSGVASLTSASENFCARLTSGEVACWGRGDSGQLGNGRFYTTGHRASAIPVAVKGVGGSGTLTGVARVTNEGSSSAYGGFCALLTSGKVDCWGWTQNSAVPVAVKGLGGAGTLGGAASLTGYVGGSCAVLTSGKVDCWGQDSLGELGNGTHGGDHPVPVSVKAVGGSGTLDGVARITDVQYGSCALLVSGSVDCWGGGVDGVLGNGTFDSTPLPKAVEGVGGTGNLSGVASLASNASGSDMSALLASGEVDCWGEGSSGQLGNGTFYTTGPPGNQGSPFPVGVLSPAP